MLPLGVLWKCSLPAVDFTGWLNAAAFWECPWSWKSFWEIPTNSRMYLSEFCWGWVTMLPKQRDESAQNNKTRSIYTGAIFFPAKKVSQSPWECKIIYFIMTIHFLGSIQSTVLFLLVMFLMWYFSRGQREQDRKVNYISYNNIQNKSNSAAVCKFCKGWQGAKLKNMRWKTSHYHQTSQSDWIFEEVQSVLHNRRCYVSYAINEAWVHSVLAVQTDGW